VSRLAAATSVVALVVAGACTDGPRVDPPGLKRIEPDPLASGCAPSGFGSLYSDSEVEPYLAIDPTNPRHWIGVWQQDRWSTGGAAATVTATSFDSGHSWAIRTPPFSVCTGGTYARATDPWVTFAPDGTAHQIAYVFSDNERAMLASRSKDGLDWSPPVVLFSDSDPDFEIDKETITADPRDAHKVYAVWDRLTGQSDPNSADNTGPTWFTRTTDAGVTWEPARLIYDPGKDAQTIGNQILVLPDGTLVNMFLLITGNSTRTPMLRIAAVRSSDGGMGWSAPIIVAEDRAVGVIDKNNHGVRSGSFVPAFTVDPSTGLLFAAWEDGRFSGGKVEGVALAMSTDGGKTWSEPAQVNQVPAAQAFTPTVAIADNGDVGMTYYDSRADTVSDTDHFLVSAWLVVSTDLGGHWTESNIGGPFDLRAAPNAGGWFLGDYEGLVHDGTSFVPFFVMTNNGDGADPTDVFARPDSIP
jgi:hypothetical protein